MTNFDDTTGRTGGLFERRAGVPDPPELTRWRSELSQEQVPVSDDGWSRVSWFLGPMFLWAATVAMVGDVWATVLFWLGGCAVLGVLVGTGRMAVFPASWTRWWAGRRPITRWGRRRRRR